MRSIAHYGTLCFGMAVPFALAACDPPNHDDYRRNGGAAPDPAGVMEGTVLYAGPRPACQRDDSGNATAVLGNVVLTLFDYDNPPPPTGGATSAVSLLVVPGEQVFALADCMPAEPTPEERTTPIMRSVPFTWPDLALGRAPCPDPDPQSPSCPGRDYQIRGFYDYDGDFNPIFSVRNQPTAGDIAGGAFQSTSAVPPIFQRIRFNNIEEEPDGQLVTGVAVTLGVPVNTDRPVFEVDPGTRAMDSASTLPTTTDPAMREEQLLALTNMRVNSIVASSTRPSEEWTRALAAAGIDDSNFVQGDPNYGFYVSTVDANSDGMPDAHPILGSAGIPYYFPIPIVRRAKNPIEQRAGIPDVLIVGTIRPTLVDEATSGGTPLESMSSFQVGIPAIAVMATNPAEPVACRIPIVAPGNIQAFYTRIPVDCQELPSGNYDVNVLSGLAGARIVDARQQCLETCDLGAAQCETVCGVTVPVRTSYGTTHCIDNPALEEDPGARPLRVCSGSYSGQAWSIPNDIGCPDRNYRLNAVNQLDADPTLQCGDEGSAMLESQSRTGGWAIVDSTDNFSPEQAETFSDGHGIATCEQAPVTPGGTPMPVAYMDVPPVCCPPALDRFCGLPLCELRTAEDVIDPVPSFGLVGPDGGPYPYPAAVRPTSGGNTGTREMRQPGVDFQLNPDGTITPLCTPFFMPADCCQIAAECEENPCGERCGARRPASCGDTGADAGT